MALAQGLEGLEDAGRAFTQLKTVALDAFNSIKAAIGSTGIGALVIALGTLVTQWDRYRDWETDRKSTRLNSSHRSLSRMPSSA